MIQYFILACSQVGPILEIYLPFVFIKKKSVGCKDLLWMVQHWGET